MFSSTEVKLLFIYMFLTLGLLALMFSFYCILMNINFKENRKSPRYKSYFI